VRARRSRIAGRADRFDGLPRSCSSVVTIVVAPIADAITVSGWVVVIQVVISSGSTPDSRFDAMPRS
jgi:hypothetical protein